jgi:hypothetical protein
VAPTSGELLTLVLAGLLQGGGQAGLVLATREAPAAVVAPFQYSQMLWAVMFGALLFGDRPEPVLFVGLAIVGRQRPLHALARDRAPAAGDARHRPRARCRRGRRAERRGAARLLPPSAAPG